LLQQGINSKKIVKSETIEKQKKKASKSEETKEEKYYCSVCGQEIDEDEYEAYDGMCWDDQLSEESEDMFGDLM